MNKIIPGSAFRYALLAIIFVTTSCHKNEPYKAKTHQEFGAALAEAFKNGDSECFSQLAHPHTPGYVAYLSAGPIERLVKKFKPKSVKVSYTTLADVGFDLAGTVDGKRLKYLAPPEGVVHLIGTDMKSPRPVTLELFIPFLKEGDRYYIPPVDFE